MDETEKYQQRLEAIAEKRRQQEEQDRARRDMEDEKIRMQQLKRKSLRDQWLMDAAPLSPKRPDAQIPRSPQSDSQTREIDEHNDKLEPESQRLAEEEEKEQEADGQVETVTVSEAGEEKGQEYVVQNGDHTFTLLETNSVKVTEMNKSPQSSRAAVVLFNGGGDCLAEDSSRQVNGAFGASAGDGGMDSEPGSGLCISDAEAGHVEVDDEEEEEGTLVIRAECVMVTDDGDDAPEDVVARGRDRMEPVLSAEPPAPPCLGAGEEAAADGARPETAAAPEARPEAKLGNFASGAEGDAQANGGGESIPASDEAAPGQWRPPAAEDTTAVVSVPVYSETQAFAAAPRAEEAEAVGSPGGAPAPPASPSGQFQEVPLADPQEKPMAAAPEREPLLSRARVPAVGGEPADAPAATDTHCPTSAGTLEETPKRKTCQCCSVM